VRRGAAPLRALFLLPPVKIVVAFLAGRLLHAVAVRVLVLRHLDVDAGADRRVVDFVVGVDERDARLALKR
jgi:hypothetical protein